MLLAQKSERAPSVKIFVAYGVIRCDYTALIVRAIDASGWLICFSCVVLAASCGGRALSTHDDPNGEGGATSKGGNSGLAGSRPSTGGASAQAGTSSTGGNARAGTSSAGGSAPAGAPGTGGNAQAGAPSDGGDGAGGTVTKGDPAAIQDACSVFCDEFNRCPDEGTPNSLCKVECFDYAYRAGSGACTAAGVDMLTCLVHADQAEANDCANAFTLAIEDCAELVDAFRDCQVDFPTPNQSTMLCAETSVVGSGQSSSCSREETCLNRIDGEIGRRTVTSSVTCVDTDDGQSSCSCEASGVTKSFTVSDTTVHACGSFCGP